tara:strand:- start:317 stop:484 length:168 start_codon:yes stop_codon:yes gene_type:complete
MTTTIFMWIIVAHIILYWITTAVVSMMRFTNEADLLNKTGNIYYEIGEIKKKIKD